MRSWMLGFLAVGACFAPQIPGGLAACPDNVCPEGLSCQAGICVANDGEACVSFDGCLADAFCVEEVGGLPSIVEDGEGVCTDRNILNLGDPCEPNNILDLCPANSGCSPEDETCRNRAGEAGDFCANALPVVGPQVVFLDYGGFTNDLEPLVVLDECQNGAVGADVFFDYTVQGAGVTLTVSTLSFNTFTDTILYASLGAAGAPGCNALDNSLVNEVACQDDDPNGGLTSTIVIPGLNAGDRVTVVLDAFNDGVESFAEVSFVED